ncbi:hypothetical protein ACLQ22_05265 [Micromonospora sp. DT178]
MGEGPGASQSRVGLARQSEALTVDEADWLGFLYRLAVIVPLA